MPGCAHTRRGAHGVQTDDRSVRGKAETSAVREEHHLLSPGGPRASKNPQLSNILKTMIRSPIFCTI